MDGAYYLLFKTGDCFVPTLFQSGLTETKKYGSELSVGKSLAANPLPFRTLIVREFARNCKMET